MLRRITVWCVLAAIPGLAGCLGDGSSELAIPKIHILNSGTPSVSPQFAQLGGGVPDGVTVTFIGDVVLLRGIHFRDNMKAFLGMNNQLARRPDSIFTTARHLLPDQPFVYTDPVTGQQTVLEVEVPVEFSAFNEVRITIPPGVACNAAFTNPVVRLFGDAGSSDPVTDVYFIVGPRCIAVTPRKGVDTGGFSVIVHGDFLSPHTQLAFRYVDPSDGITKVVGDQPENDIVEHYIDRHTLVVSSWPGIVPDSTFGLADDLAVDVLLFENIDSITGSLILEPGLGGSSPCDALRPESPEVPLQDRGVRNSEKAGGFTFIPTGVTDVPSIAGITPETGPEVGGNTVVIHGDQFDAFSADISDAANPGIGIECPPDSGSYVPPLSAILVDRQTLVVRMPPCSVDVPREVNICLRNKFSIDNPGGVPSAGPGNDCVVFSDLYTYLPIPPIQPPVVTAIHPDSGHDYGLERFLVVGNWFDSATTLNGGFEFLLPGGEVVQSLRTILHNRNLIEVYTRRLPDSVYPLSEDLLVGIRVRNTVGHADLADAFTFEATPDNPSPPVLTGIHADTGPLEGGNQILVFGADYDTTSQVFFGAVAATDVQFVHTGLLIATAPPAVAAGDVEVTVVDGADTSAAVTYTYTGTPAAACATLGSLDPRKGSSTGGYTILAYGIDLSPLTRIEFGTGDGNFSQEIFYLSQNLLRVRVPEAFPAQIGALVEVGATDPLNGCDEASRTVGFQYVAAGEAAPEIFFVDTTVEAPGTVLPALRVAGGDRMLVIGRNFDQGTTFDIEKPQASGATSDCTGIEVLTPNLAIMTSPASPNGAKGVADLKAHNEFGDSDGFPVEYTDPGPPAIFDVRNLDDGTTTAPIDANDRLIIFGDSFFAPVTVRLTGCDVNDPTALVTLTLKAPDVTLVEDHLIGVNVPRDTFCEGPLDIEVGTEFGTVSFDTATGDPIFQLIGPQPPVVDGVFPQSFNSSGGEEAVFFGRNFTDTTEFSVRTEPMGTAAFTPVLTTRFVSAVVAIVTMPGLPGGLPPLGAAGFARAEETDPVLAGKVSGDPFTTSGELYRVRNDDTPVLLAVHPDHGFIDGGEQVLLIGAGFLTATGESNVTDLAFVDPVLGDVGDYIQAGLLDLPIDSLDPANQGKFLVLSDNEILVITNARPPIEAPAVAAPADVRVESIRGDTILRGGYTYRNTPAVITPFLLGLTPNETRLNGTTSHLLSGGFLTEADRIVLTRSSDGATFTIPASGYREVHDTFLVLVMPDLSAVFDEGDLLDIRAEKDVDSGTLVSNTMHDVLKVSFAGPPVITPDLSPAAGTAFGGNVVEIGGAFFTPNSQVLFGTMPARHVVFDNPGRILAIAPTLPVDVPAPGIDLRNIHAADGSVDVAIFTAGGWAVLKDGYTFEPARPVVDSCSPDMVRAGESIHMVVTGGNFVPGSTTATPLAGSGTVTSLVVHTHESLSFDYEAPTFAPGTAGPKVDRITIETNQGTADGTCDITILLPPSIDDCSTSYTLGDRSAPTTGIEDGTFVVVTVEGRNFVTGSTLRLTSRGGTTFLLREIDAADPFGAGGQFRVVAPGTIEFTVPYIFGNQVGNIIDGNPNVGRTTLSLRGPLDPAAVEAECFAYVPIFIDFQLFSYPIPTVEPKNTAPDKLTTGDINQDGVLDLAVLARQNADSLLDPEAFLYIADTFGAGVDVNGDGIAPDFAGTFTRFVISNDSVKTDLYKDGRGAKIRMANLDGDDPLEVIIPTRTLDGGSRVRLLVVDVDADGTLGAQKLIASTTAGSPRVISGIAVGNFDSGHAGPDVMLLVETHDFILFASTATAFTFTNKKTAVDTSFAKRVGFLESGDFDGDGDHDLIWGMDGGSGSPVVVAEVDASTGTILSQKKITNLTGGAVFSISTFDADGDGKEDAFVLFEDEAKGSLVTGIQPSGIGSILAPLGLLADAFQTTGFNRSGRAMDKGDFNADGNLDLAATSNYGEFLVFFGDGKGGIANSGRSWTLPTLPGLWPSRVHGLAAGDINQDGIAEVFIGDLGVNPMAIALFLNVSR